MSEFLTHHDQHAAGEACALWCIAIRHAVLTGDIDIRIGLPHLKADAANYWLSRIWKLKAEPASSTCISNGWVVEAFQAAWCEELNGPLSRAMPITTETGLPRQQCVAAGERPSCWHNGQVGPAQGDDISARPADFLRHGRKSSRRLAGGVQSRPPGRRMAPAIASVVPQN